MTYKIKILPAAWEDLKRIEDWYLIQFDAETALNVTNHILDAIERLEAFPDSGSLTPDDWLKRQGYRMVICRKHAAIYRLIEESVAIGCLWTFRDAPSQLSGNAGLYLH